MRGSKALGILPNEDELRLLEFVPPEKLSIVPDCGFSQIARWAARAKLRSMVDGARLVRDELVK